jgi:hypothetical protein
VSSWSSILFLFATASALDLLTVDLTMSVASANADEFDIRLSLPHDAIALAGSVVGDPFMRLAAAFVFATVVARLACPVAAVTLSLELLVFKPSEVIRLLTSLFPLLLLVNFSAFYEPQMLYQC